MNRAQLRRLEKAGVKLDEGIDPATIEVRQLSACSGCGEVEFAMLTDSVQTSTAAQAAACLRCGKRRVWGDVTVSARLFYENGQPKMVFDRPSLNDEASDRLDTWVDAWQRYQIGILRDLRDKGLEAVSEGIRNAVRVQVLRGRV